MKKHKLRTREQVNEMLDVVVALQRKHDKELAELRDLNTRLTERVSDLEIEINEKDPEYNEFELEYESQ